MGLRNFFRKQLSTVIEWKNQQLEILFYKIETPTDEIKNASKLIVSPGQGCLLVYEGKIQNHLEEPGTYVLATDNHPFITNLLKLRQAFESEHKMHIYFYRTAESLNLRWGSATPVKYVDPVYKFPVQLGVYGNYSIRLKDAAGMFSQLIGSKNLFTTADLQKVVSARIAPVLAAVLGEAGYSYSEIDKKLLELSGQSKEILNQTFAALGLELTHFRIEATTFDEETQERINKIAEMTSETLSAAEAGLSYAELEKLRALRDAAKNEGGLAGAGFTGGRRIGAKQRPAFPKGGTERSKERSGRSDGSIEETETLIG